MRGLSEESESDLLDSVGEDSDRGNRSGALYASMLVVWVSSMGPEILLRTEYPLAVVLLRCIPRSWEDCFRLVVKARARDILAVVSRLLLDDGVVLENTKKLPEYREMQKQLGPACSDLCRVTQMRDSGCRNCSYVSWQSI